LVGGSCTLGLEGLETIDNASGGAWDVDKLAMLALDWPWLKEKKIDLKICRKLQWCHYNKQLEQNKQIEEDQRPKHANELETCTTKKSQTIIWTKKEKKEVKATIIVDYITLRIKSLVLELEFITLKIEGFDLDKQSWESCKL